MTASERLLREVEIMRASRGLTQAALASRLGVSQAHYSKVVGRIVPLSTGLAERVRSWVDENASGTRLSHSSAEMEELARSIRRDARRLAHLLRASGV